MPNRTRNRGLLGRATHAIQRQMLKSFFGLDFETAELLLNNHSWTLGRRSGLAGLAEPFKNHAWVRKAAHITANSISQVPIVFYDGPPDDEEREKVENPQLRELFANPNPMQTETQFWYATMVYQLMRGQCLWIAERPNVATLPQELWPVGPKGWEPQVDKTSKMITGWTFRGTDGKALEFAPWEVIQHKFFNPDDPTSGLSRIQAALTEVSLDRKAQQSDLKTLENAAVPLGALQTDAELDDDQVNIIQQQWESRHQGPNRRGRIAVLHSGLGFDRIGLTPEESQRAEQRGMTREDIAAAFNCPWEIMGFGKATFENYREAEKVWWRTELLPDMGDLEEVTSERLVLPATAGRVWAGFDTTEVAALQPDLTERLEQARILIENRVPWSEADRRLKLELEEFPGYEEAFVPFNLVPLSDSGTPEAPPEEERTAKQKEPEEGEAPAPPFTGARADAYWNEFAAKVLDPMERKFRSRLNGYFMRQRAEQLSLFEEWFAEQGTDLVERGGVFVRALRIKQAELDAAIDQFLFDEETWNEQLQETLHPLYEEIITEAGEDMGTLLGIDFEPANPQVAEFVRLKESRVTEINVTTRERLRAGIKTTLADGIEIGEGISQLATRVDRVIRDVYNDANRRRSFTIARTEVATSANGTRFWMMQNEGVNFHEWISSRDAEVRDTHQIDGEVRRVGSEFSNGLLYPGQVGGPPEEVINCRCVAVPVVKE